MTNRWIMNNLMTQPVTASDVDFNDNGQSQVERELLGALRRVK